MSSDGGEGQRLKGAAYKINAQHHSSPLSRTHPPSSRPGSPLAPRGHAHLTFLCSHSSHHLSHSAGVQGTPQLHT